MTACGGDKCDTKVRLLSKGCMSESGDFSPYRACSRHVRIGSSLRHSTNNVCFTPDSGRS